MEDKSVVKRPRYFEENKIKWKITKLRKRIVTINKVDIGERFAKIVIPTAGILFSIIYMVVGMYLAHSH